VIVWESWLHSTDALPDRPQLLLESECSMTRKTGLLTTVYTRAGDKLTAPQESCTLVDIKLNNIARGYQHDQESVCVNNTQGIFGA